MNNARILIADDDRLILATLGEGLRQAGFEVIEAEHGEEAIELCRQHRPHLAILDIRMPGINGIETAGRLQQETGTPFMMFSAYDAEEEIRRAIAGGALGYLVKPLDVAQIVPAVKAALGRATEIRQLQESELHLQTALDGNRTTSIAVGLLMERYQLDRNGAFEKLRKYARNHRRKLAEVADELVRAGEILNLSQSVTISKGIVKPDK